MGKKMLKAHRASYSLFVEPIPNNMHVLHRCDVPSCVNPSHLFLGTHSDNMKDMWDKERHKPPSTKTKAKLTKDEVIFIYACKGVQSAQTLSEAFLVNTQTIYNIWNKVTWKDILC
jgi:hypothetical protein